MARKLLANAQIHLRIEGHTSSNGSNGYNRRLSGSRAAAVQAGVPCLTTIEAASAAVMALEALREEEMQVQALQDRFAPVTR